MAEIFDWVRGIFGTSQEYTDYTVIEGDTLWSIALAQLGAAERWPEIERLNRIVDPNLIFPGQELRLPPR